MISVMCVRHARTVGYGVVDTFLCKEGEERAAAVLPPLWRSHRFDRVLCSPLRRAIQTLCIGYRHEELDERFELCDDAREWRRTLGDERLEPRELSEWLARWHGTDKCLVAGQVLSRLSLRARKREREDDVCPPPKAPCLDSRPSTGVVEEPESRCIGPAKETRVQLRERAQRVLDSILATLTERGSPVKVLLVAHAAFLECLSEVAADCGYLVASRSESTKRMGYCDSKWVVLRSHGSAARSSILHWAKATKTPPG
jgi:broad specificity phosphatase PhoE